MYLARLLKAVTVHCLYPALPLSAAFPVSIFLAFVIKLGIINQKWRSSREAGN